MHKILEIQSQGTYNPFILCRVLFVLLNAEQRAAAVIIGLLFKLTDISRYFTSSKNVGGEKWNSFQCKLFW